MENRKIKIKIEKNYIIFILFVYFFAFKDWLEGVISFIKILDELIALCAIPISIVQLCRNFGIIRCARRGGYYRWILLLVVEGLLGNLIYGYQPFKMAVFPDLLLCTKFWLCITVGKYVFQSFSLEKWADRVLWHIKLILWIYTVLIIADNIQPMFKSSIRYGLRSTQLFYSHPTVFVSCCVFLMAILMMLRGCINSKKERKYFIWISILMCSTLRSKAFGCVMAFWFIYYFVYYRKKKFQLRTILIVAPLIVLLGWEQIEFYFLSDLKNGSARYQLLVKSIEVAKDHFPLGAGFGTFGSHYSAVFYSPLYRMYQLSGIHGLVENHTYFVSDSYWPMILGQFGWIGMIAMVMAIYALFKQIQVLRFINSSYYATGLFILAHLMIESVAGSAFVHPLATPLALLLGYILRLNKEKC